MIETILPTIVSYISGFFNLYFELCGSIGKILGISVGAVVMVLVAFIPLRMVIEGKSNAKKQK